MIRMKLYLVQHGEAYSKSDDPKRPLTEKGKSDANRLAVFLRQANVKVDHVVHSGKLRAQQTAERLVSANALGKKLETHEGLNPNDDPVTFAVNLEKLPGNSLIVAHMPFLSKLVAHLIVGNTDSLITAYTPGAVACLEFTPSSNSWSLNWMVRPELFN